MTEKPLHIPMSVDDLLTAAVNHVPRALMEKWLGKTHCGDCVEILNRMPAESVDLFVTSPPYNIRNSTGNGLKDGRGGKWANAALLNGYSDHDDAMPHDEYVEWQRACLAAMVRVLKPDGAIFYNHKWRVQAGLLQHRHDIVEGFPVRQIIIWQRDGGINFNPGYFLPTYEVIYLICKPDFRLAPKANAVGDVWRIPQESSNPHPAAFPLELVQRCIQATTAKIIGDPFMGSGTTAIAAEASGREWFGIDLSKAYCKLAEERILAARRLYRAATVTPLRPVFTEHAFDTKGRLVGVRIQSRSKPHVQYPMWRASLATWATRPEWQHRGVTCEAGGVGRECWHVDAMNEYEQERGEQMTNELAIAPARTSEAMALQLTDLVERDKLIKQFFREVMVKDQDYGIIPGTDKPTLLKPGAESLCEFYSYAIGIKDHNETINHDTGFLRVVMTIALTKRATGELVAEGVGEANTMEGRYRWRTGQRACPTCGAAAIIKGKAEYGGGWVCFAKKSGCGAKFRDGDAAIESQPSGRVENDDPWTLWNTVLKMAKKRALVDATLSATRSSGLFTQDMEELSEWMATGDGVEVTAPPRPRAATERPASRPTNGAQPPSTASAEERAQLRGLLNELKVYEEARGDGWWPRRKTQIGELFPSAKDSAGGLVINRLTDVNVRGLVALCKQWMTEEPPPESSGLRAHTAAGAAQAAPKAARKPSAPMQPSSAQRVQAAIERLVAETDREHQRGVYVGLGERWSDAFTAEGTFDCTRAAVSHTDRGEMEAYILAALDGPEQAPLVVQERQE